MNLLELIQVSVMMKVMKLVEYKHLSVDLKRNRKRIKHKNKKLVEPNKKTKTSIKIDC